MSARPGIVERCEGCDYLDSFYGCTALDDCQIYRDAKAEYNSDEDYDETERAELDKYMEGFDE